MWSERKVTAAQGRRWEGWPGASAKTLRSPFPTAEDRSIQLGGPLRAGPAAGERALGMVQTPRGQSGWNLAASHPDGNAPREKGTDVSLSIGASWSAQAALTKHQGWGG